MNDMEHLLQLLPDEHISAFPGRFHRLGVFGDFKKSCIFLGVTNTLFKPRRFLGNGQRVLYSRVNADLHSAFGFDDNFKKLLTPFLTEEDAQAINNKRLELHKLKIIGECSLKNEGWRWCSQCVIEDQDTFGLAYYHHSHQIPGVFHCNKHHARLSSACARCGLSAPTLREMLLPPQNNLCPRCGFYITPEDSCYDETVNAIEIVITNLLTGQNHFTLSDFRHYMCKHIGIDLNQPASTQHNRRLNEWKKFVSSYLTPHAKETYFRQTKKDTFRIKANDLLCNSRVYKTNNAKGVLHPLVHLIALKAAGHEIFNGR